MTTHFNIPRTFEKMRKRLENGKPVEAQMVQQKKNKEVFRSQDYVEGPQIVDMARKLIT